MSDTISRQAAIDALWKALYAYENKTEKQFIESDELDINDWIQHRIFVQNMSDIDRQTIQNLPAIEAEPTKHYNTESYKMTVTDFPPVEYAPIKHGRWIYDDEAYPGGNPYGHYNCDQCGESVPHKTIYCPNCGARMFDKDTDVPDKNVGKMDEVENG